MMLHGRCGHEINSLGDVLPACPVCGFPRPDWSSVAYFQPPPLPALHFTERDRAWLRTLHISPE